MDRVRVGLPGRLQHRLLIEIRIGRPGRTDVVRLVGVSDVAGVFVGLAVDGDRPDTQLLTGAHHTDRDLAPVGDENFAEHVLPYRRLPR